jgi:hypothetical protein
MQLESSTMEESTPGRRVFIAVAEGLAFGIQFQLGKL